MTHWLLYAAIYAGPACYTARLALKEDGGRRLSWWLGGLLGALWPLVMLLGWAIMLGRLRHFRIRGYVTRTRKAVMGELATHPAGDLWRVRAEPDDGGFFDD